MGLNSVLTKLKKFKSSNVATFLGSGDSINRIKGRQWDKIRQTDMWTVNNWIYHPYIVPNFYHLEVKKDNVHYWSKNFLPKRNSYNDTTFLLNENSHKGTFKLVENMPRVYSYPSVFPFTDDCDPTYSINDKLITHSCGASLTVIFEFIFRLGYDKLVLMGVDLDSKYFWTDDITIETHIRTNYNQAPKSPHMTTTKGIKEFIIGFNEYHMKRNGREIVLGYDETPLITDLKVERY